VQKYGFATGISVQVNGLCVHSLRATAATNALSHEADIAKVQEWLGHANIATTRIYDHRKTRPAIKSQDHSRASLQVIRRFCLTVSFFAVWAMARQQLDPMLHFGAMLRAASVVCAVLAVFGRARIADQQLNRWDEAFSYLAIALSVDLWEQL
jgi:Phage integrase family